jgi:hypothetical protein
MRPRGGIARLAGLYGMVERMRSLELRAAAGNLDEVASAQTMQAAVHRSEVSGSRAAFASGDREQWKVAETARALLEIRMARLNKLRAEREVKLDQAAQAYNRSRVRMEQMDRVVERERERLACEAARRAQAEADDRFASRRAWSERASRRNRA